MEDYFSQLLNVHKDNDIEEIEIQPFEIAIEKLKKYKSPGIDQIPAELI